jgi:hypothetical protein
MNIQSAIGAAPQINRKVSAAVRQFGPISVERGLAVRRDHFAKDQQNFGQGDSTNDVYTVVHEFAVGPAMDPMVSPQQRC